MGNENGQWVLCGTHQDDPARIRTLEQLLAAVDAFGFLPLFRNSVPGFSLEERTLAAHWWSEDASVDPWCWRALAAESGKVAYGKFFDKKAGFVSLRWLPRFANWRRDGYDFDARWEDGKASYRAMRIMSLFADGRALLSGQAKQEGGFGKGGEKNFSGIVTDLQMQTYLVICALRCKIARNGLPYGWPMAV